MMVFHKTRRMEETHRQLAEEGNIPTTSNAFHSLRGLGDAEDTDAVMNLDRFS